MYIIKLSLKNVKKYCCQIGENDKRKHVIIIIIKYPNKKASIEKDLVQFLKQVYRDYGLYVIC